jgi:hypothetical protein
MVARSAAADAVYRTLLRLYPLRFQEEFAADMALDFADASDDAWTEKRWLGLVGVWARTGIDLAHSLPLQWLRTRLPLFALVGFVVALTTTAAAVSFLPDQPIVFNVKAPDHDSIVLLLLTACLLLVIAATIILNVCLLRRLLHRGRARMLVNSTRSLRI